VSAKRGESPAMWRPVRRLLAAAALCAAGLVASGCGLGAGKGSGDVRVTVTTDFGGRRVGAATTSKTPGGETVMRFLQRNFRVQTRYGGGFVETIDGLSGSTAGDQLDWFYYVNGIEASVGAAAMRLHPGDRVWWDRHDWTVAMRVPAVVGSFPEPFKSGSDGKRFPVRLVCQSDEERSCDEVQTRLEDADITGISRATLEQSGGKEVLRVIVGRWADVRRDPVVRSLERGPGSSGVYARPTSTGDSIVLLDGDGRPVRTLRGGAGLVAATSVEAQAPTWIIAGTDDVGLAAAAAALTEERLEQHFAVAVDAGQDVPLPVSGPGTGP
jgi:Domain of unknown function (DUF4430)